MPRKWRFHHLSSETPSKKEMTFAIFCRSKFGILSIKKVFTNRDLTHCLTNENSKNHFAFPLSPFQDVVYSWSFSLCGGSGYGLAQNIRFQPPFAKLGDAHLGKKYFMGLQC